MLGLKRLLRKGKEMLECVWLTGSDVFCPCCETSFSNFAMGGVETKRRARCPKCGSLERHRAFARWLSDHPKQFHEGVHVLHLAPELHIAKILSNRADFYVSGDLMPARGQLKLDLTNLPFKEGSFDIVVASHILEHIPDDAKAMQEIHRVLKPFGWACLTTPVKNEQEKTDEDFTVTDPNERRRRFGQADHVRWYGRDFYDRLAAAGLTVRREMFDDERIGCVKEEVLICSKQPYG